MNTVFQVLTLAWSLQGGQYITNSMADENSFSVNSPYFVTTSFEIQIPFSWTKGDPNGIFIGANTETQFFKNPDQLGFDPWQDNFKINAGIRFIGIEFGVEHECIHPITADYRKENSKYFAAYDKLYGKISGTF